MAQAEQERFGIPAERLSGGQKIRAADVQTDPLGGPVVEGLRRSGSPTVVATDLAVTLGHSERVVLLKCVTVTASLSNDQQTRAGAEKHASLLFLGTRH